MFVSTLHLSFEDFCFLDRNIFLGKCCCQGHMFKMLKTLLLHVFYFVYNYFLFFGLQYKSQCFCQLVLPFNFGNHNRFAT